MCSVGFAKVPSKAAILEDGSVITQASLPSNCPTISPEKRILTSNSPEDHRSILVPSILTSKANAEPFFPSKSMNGTLTTAQALQTAINAAPLPYLLSDDDEAPRPSISELQTLLRELTGTGDPELDVHFNAFSGKSARFFSNPP